MAKDVAPLVGGGGVNRKHCLRCFGGTDWVTHVVLMQDLEHFVDVVEGVHPGGPSLFGLAGTENERERAEESERKRERQRESSGERVRGQRPTKQRTGNRVLGSTPEGILQNNNNNTFYL